ncbi:Hsp70 family protein [Halobacteriovorax sp. JY17]|uniref:Hsp70 family protein n=1 Tax=Halobacteriovorax sp. JY17 TaxID=2014617 RepID=UPI000C62CE3B|nr:Hsp70 family protein [Halobacteriovorax sp. JY17]PIK16401.1 MAG: hypothetical protein CES88_06585 [Halobacteriovorax sp. JY17]
MNYYAIDFGTSNSLINHISDSNEITPIPMEGDSNFILRSLIFTMSQREWFFGEEAIAEYTENNGEGRFFRSLKKFLADPHFKGTEIHNKKYSIEAIIAIFLREMKERADLFTGMKVENVVMGRPAKYSLSKENDQLAEDRMRKACELAGFTNIHFCPEPLAAGLDFDKDNVEKKIVLIADFGGGTSDFTLMQLHTGQYTQDDILGLSGVYRAGDSLDGEMMRKFIAKHFGAKFSFTLPMGNQTLTFPRALLKKICSPALITQLREKETWEYLKTIHPFAKDQENKRHLDQLFSLVDYQLGYTVFQEIEKSKITICSNDIDLHTFLFSYGDIDVKEEIQKEKYVEAMEPVVEEIINAMMEVFTQSGLNPSQVDEVVLTGGTAQFTQIQNRLKEVFGSEKLVEHDIYQSVVGGLSQYATLL